MDRRALHVAMPVRPDLGPCAALADERVVGRNATVALDAHDLAEVVCEVLRFVAELLPLAHRDEEPAVARKRQPRTVVRIARLGGLLLEDHRERIEPVGRCVERAPTDRRCADVVARLGVGEIHSAIRGELGIERDVEQAALPPRKNARHAG